MNSACKRFVAAFLALILILSARQAFSGPYPALALRESQEDTAVSVLERRLRPAAGLPDGQAGGGQAGLEETVRFSDRTMSQVAAILEDHPKALLAVSLPPRGRNDRREVFREMAPSPEEAADRFLRKIPRALREQAESFSYNLEIAQPVDENRPANIRITAYRPFPRGEPLRTFHELTWAQLSPILSEFRPYPISVIRPPDARESQEHQILEIPAEVSPGPAVKAVVQKLLANKELVPDDEQVRYTLLIFENPTSEEGLSVAAEIRIRAPEFPFVSASAGLEETAPGKRRRYDPAEVAGRILDALVSDQELSHWKGTIVLSHNQAAKLAGGKPYRKSFDTNPGLTNGVNRAFETAFAVSTPAAQALRNSGIAQVVIEKGVDAKDTAYDPGEVVRRLLEKLLVSPKNRQGVENGSLILPYKRASRLLDRRPTGKAFADNGSLVNRINMALYHAFKEKPPSDSEQAFTHWELALRLKKKGISRVRLQKARYSYDPTEVAYRLMEELLKEGTFSGEVALPFLRASKLLAGEPSVPTLMQNGTLAVEINRVLTQAFEMTEPPADSDVHPLWTSADKLRGQSVTSVRIFNAGAGYYRPPAGLEEPDPAPLNVNWTRQDLLLSHLQQLRRASQANTRSIANLDDETLFELAAAILDGAPYRDQEALIRHLNGRVRSVKNPQAEAIARSLQTGITRRQFGFRILAGAATSTLVGAGLGWLWNRWGPVMIPEELVHQGRVTDVLGLILRDSDHLSVRSAEATRAMTQALLDARPSFLTQERKLTVLYPGSGSHVTPLEIASRLIVENYIDEAHYIFTEINEKALLELEEFLLALVEHGLYRNFSRKEQAFEEGREITFRLEFQGKPITLLFALNRSGEKKFWRPEYVQAVHLVYSHDASPGEQRFYADLLEDFYGDGTDRGELFLMGEDARRHGVFFKNILATDMPEGIEFGHFDPELLGAVTPVPYGFGHRSTMTRQEESRHPEQVTHDERGDYVFPAAHLVQFDGIFLRKLSSLPNQQYRVLSDLSAAAAGRPVSVDYFFGRALYSSDPILWGIDLQRGVREILDVVPEDQTIRRARLLLDALSVHWSTGYAATARKSISRDVFISWFLQEPEVIWLAEKLAPVIDAVPELLGGSGEAIEPNDFRKQWRSAVGELLVQVVSPMSDEQLTLQPLTRDWIYLHTLKRQAVLAILISGTPGLFLERLGSNPDSIFHTVREIGRFGFGRSREKFQNDLLGLPDHPSVPPSQKEPLRQAVEDALQKIRSIEQEDHQQRRPAGGSTPLTAGLEERELLAGLPILPDTQLSGHTDWVRSAVFSPDGSKILTASNDRTARLWEASSGKPLLTLQGHTDWVRSAVFSPDGSRILTASDDGTARLWEASSGKPLLTLQGHTGGVFSAVFSPDGSRILTASNDGTARLWKASSGKPLLTLRGHTDWVRSAVFSPDGSKILTASDDRTARLFGSSEAFRALASQPGVSLEHIRQMASYLSSLPVQEAQAAEGLLLKLVHSPDSSPLLDSLRSGALGERVWAASFLHRMDRLVPQELHSAFHRLPTHGSRQAALISITRYQKGELSFLELKNRISSLARWERSAQRQRGKDHLQALELHSGIPEGSERSKTIQRLLELFMRVEGNLREDGSLHVSTRFEGKGLEWQTLPSHHWKTQAYLLTELEELARSEHFALFGPISNHWEDRWLHYNANSSLQGEELALPLYLWVAQNAELAQKAGQPRAFRPKADEDSNYTLWNIRDPRGSHLGGTRTEITGMLWVTNSSRHRKLARLYREKLLETLDRAVWAFRNRAQDPKAAQAWSALSRSPAGVAPALDKSLPSLQSFYDTRLTAAGGSTPLTAGLEEARVVLPSFWKDRGISRQTERLLDNPRLGGIPSPDRDFISYILQEILNDINEWGYQRQRGFRTFITARRKLHSGQIQVEIQDQVARHQRANNRSPQAFQFSHMPLPPADAEEWTAIVEEHLRLTGREGGLGSRIVRGFLDQGRFTLEESFDPEVGNRYLLTFPLHDANDIPTAAGGSTPLTAGLEEKLSPHPIAESDWAPAIRTLADEWNGEFLPVRFEGGYLYHVAVSGLREALRKKRFEQVNPKYGRFDVSEDFIRDILPMFGNAIQYPSVAPDAALLIIPAHRFNQAQQEGQAAVLHKPGRGKWPFFAGPIPLDWVEHLVVHPDIAGTLASVPSSVQIHPYPLDGSLEKWFRSLGVVDAQEVRDERILVPRKKSPAGGLEERTSESVRLLRQVPPAIPGSVGNEALVFLPGTYDLAAVAAQMGAAVAVPDDGPEAAGLEELLRAMHVPADRYAVGTLQASRFLERYPRQILIEDRPKGFRILGLRWDDLPPPVSAALESVLAFLDSAPSA